MANKTAAWSGAAAGAIAATTLIVGGNAALSRPSSVVVAPPPDLVGWLTTTPALPGPERRSVLLERLASHPEEAGLIADALDQTAAATTQPTASNAAADLAVLDALQRALTTTRSIAEADAIASTRKTVVERATRRLEAAARRLADQAKSPNGMPPVDSEWAAELDRVVSLQIEGTLNAPACDPLVTDVVTRTIATVRSRVVEANTLVDRLGEKITVAGGAIDPVPADTVAARGQCAIELAALQQAAASIGDDRLHRWASTVSGTPQRDLLAVESDLAQATDRVGRMQIKLYNLWALREIYGAEDSDVVQWPAGLSLIDRALLHPSVAAMWNLVHDRRFAEVVDRARRPSVVRTLMTGTPVGLDRF